jgi:hypothetical protein
MENEWKHRIKEPCVKVPASRLEVAMESLFGMPYLKNGEITLRMLHRYQEDIRKAINTGLPSAPARLSIPPATLFRLAEMMKVPKFRPFESLLHPR